VKLKIETANNFLVLILLGTATVAGYGLGPLFFILVILVLVLLKPRGPMWWPWLALIPVLLNAILPRPFPPSAEILECQLGRRCESLMSMATRIASEKKIMGLVAGAGEAVDPGETFSILHRITGPEKNVTAFLSDDRGRIVAWGGSGNAYPPGLRSIGPRLVCVKWTCLNAILSIREPLIVEGRIIGAVTITEHSPLTTRSAFGISVPPGWRMSLGRNRSGFFELNPAGFPMLSLPVAVDIRSEIFRPVPSWVGWMILILVLFRNFETMAMIAAAGGTLTALADGSGGILTVMLATFGLLLGRVIGKSPWKTRRIAVLGGLAVFAAVVFPIETGGTWLARHLLNPGPGLIWILGGTWIAGGWPSRGRGLSSLFRRALLVLGPACVFSGLFLLVPRPEKKEPHPRIPRGEVLNLDTFRPVKDCALFDLATLMATRWDLDQAGQGVLLRVFNASGREISRWGDLAAAGGKIIMDRSWEIPEISGKLELWRPTEPWSLLGDWMVGQERSAREDSPVWYAVSSRSGMPAAGLHPGVGGLDPAKASDLYRSGRGWTLIEVRGRKMPARVTRAGPWLVLEIFPVPPISTWIARLLVSLLWILAADAVSGLWSTGRRQDPVNSVSSLPPGICNLDPGPDPVFRSDGRPAFSFRNTFGGKLRILVAAAVIIPLGLLTIILQFRLRSREKEIDDRVAIDAFRSLRYVAENLSGGTMIDDELARWLSDGWIGEISIFDGAELVAVSRPDLIDTGVLPELPEAELIPRFFLGRDEPLTAPRGRGLVVGGTFEFEGRRLLLEMYRGKQETAESPASPVDWLLGGAGIAALLALALARKIEDGLGRSLDGVLGVSRRLVDGESLEKLPPPPPERDLAEVVAAVENMARKVQEREIRLKDQEEMLRILLATLESAVFLLDDNGELLFVNSAAENLLREQTGSRIQQILKEDIPSGQGLLRPSPGQDRSWRVSSAGIPLPAGGKGRVVVIEDVSEMLRAQRLEQLTQMARIIAHEVKNPLTPIRLWVQELDESRKSRRGDLDRLVEEACPALLKQVERLRESANAFSNLVALENWESERTDLAELIDRVVDDMDLPQRQGIRIHRYVAGSGLCADVDPRWLRRALDTLVLNSLTAIGDRPGTIAFRVFSDGRRLVLEVEDDGGGVKDTDLDDLFSPHFSSTQTGTGLGLALVQQVMHRAQGDVFAENGRKGLVIRLVFPGAPPKTP